MVIACDNRKYWRKDKFPHYKASRKKSRQDSGFDWKMIFDTLTEIRAELAVFFPYPVIDVDGAEADDVIAVLAQWTQTNNLVQEGLDETPEPVLILSGDHDFIQLQKFKNVQQYSPIHKKWVKPDSSISSYLMEHIIKGDKGDGIPNILSADDCFITNTRQKPVTAKKLESWQLLNIDDFHNHVEIDIARNFQRNRYLIDFEYIPDAVRNNIVGTWSEQPKKDRSQLLNYFMEHKMKNMIDHLSEF
jgi:hypothetical protein